MSRVTVTLLLAVIPATAAADGVHEFATLDRASGQSGAGVDLSFVTGDLGDASGAISRLDLHGQYMHSSGFGGYGNFALSKAFLSAGDNPLAEMLVDAVNEPTAMSNLELGVQYKRKLTGELGLVGHAGLALPTSQSDDFGAGLVNLLSIQRRFNDLVTAVPDVTTLRIGISPTWQRGVVFARADLGADIAIDTPNNMEIDPIVHANIAVGARQGKLSGALELVTLGTTGDVAEDEDRFLHTGALSLRYDAGRFAPSLTVVSPLDEGLGDVITIGGGVAATF